MFLEILQNSQENTCARVSFLIKLQARPATLLKKRLWHRCFPVNFAKFLRKPFLQNTSERLLLDELLCREILLFEPYKFKARTREKGNSWKAIANNLISLDEFKVHARAVRERCCVIKAHFEAQEKEEKNAP